MDKTKKTILKYLYQTDEQRTTAANMGFASGGGFCKLQAHFFSGRKFWRLPFTAE